MSKLVFDASPWDDGAWIVTVRPDWEKQWKDVPVGGVVDRDTAKRIAKWLNCGGYAEVERIFRNGYEEDITGTTNSGTEQITVQTLEAERRKGNPPERSHD